MALRQVFIDEDRVILGGKLFQQLLLRWKKEDENRLLDARGLLKTGALMEFRRQRLA
jgi:hypothetical protein